jgi:hypothetical protein
MENENLKNKIQSIFLTLSDGTVAQFSGPAVCEEGDERTIHSVKFGEPQDLVDGMSFEKVDFKKKNLK